MRFLFLLAFSCLLFGNSAFLSAQTVYAGKYDVRFVINNVNCVVDSLTIDLEVKSTHPDSTFFMGDQNYRFTYNKNAIRLKKDVNGNPYVLEELGFSGQLKDNPTNPASAFMPYNPHFVNELVNSRQPFALAYVNVVWQPGRNGILVPSNTWVPVCRLSFDIVDATELECLDLTWRPQNAVGGWVCNITEVQSVPPVGSAQTQPFSTTATTVEGNYLNDTRCLDVICQPNNLPVEWASFDVQYNGNASTLNWRTISEVNNNFFMVERSIDGVVFESLDRIESVGPGYDYTYNDNTVNELSTKSVFYRVRQVDFDGSSATSNQLELNLDDGNSTVDVFYDVMSDGIKVFYQTDLDRSLTCTIYDMGGRAVQETIQNQVTGSIQQISVAQLPAGVYILHLQDGFDQRVARFQIQR